MTRDQIIEAMARAIFDDRRPKRLTGELIPWDDPDSITPMNCRADATAALAAIEAAGAVIVPREGTVEMGMAFASAIEADGCTPSSIYAAMLNASPFKETTNAG
jgi:hypothetical protein